MKKITKKEFDNLPVVDGYRICPGNTDYSDIKEFPNNCKFRNGCIFGCNCKFGRNCEFGIGCIFGNVCIFGGSSYFSDDCIFGKWCDFGSLCGFGRRCVFDKWCSFGCFYNFGRDCIFEGKYKANDCNPFIRVSGVDNRNNDLYIYNFKEGIYIKIDTFFGNEEEFLQSYVFKCYDNKYIKMFIGQIVLAKEYFKN